MTPTGADHPPMRRSVWPYIALLVALGLAVGFWIEPPAGAALAWTLSAYFGIAAGIVGVVRDQRILWRSIAALSVLFSLFATGVPSLFIWLAGGAAWRIVPGHAARRAVARSRTSLNMCPRSPTDKLRDRPW